MKDTVNNKVPNANYRKDKIPKWINTYAAFVMLFLLARALILYIEPTWALYNISEKTITDDFVLKSLGAVHIMMAFLVFSALGSQNSMFMVFGYMVNIVVNVQLLILVPYYFGFISLIGGVGFPVVLMFIILEFLAIVQLRKLTVVPFEK